MTTTAFLEETDTEVKTKFNNGSKNNQEKFSS